METTTQQHKTETKSKAVDDIRDQLKRQVENVDTDPIMSNVGNETVSELEQTIKNSGDVTPEQQQKPKQPTKQELEEAKKIAEARDAQKKLQTELQDLHGRLEYKLAELRETPNPNGLAGGIVGGTIASGLGFSLLNHVGNTDRMATSLVKSWDKYYDGLGDSASADIFQTAKDFLTKKAGMGGKNDEMKKAVEETANILSATHDKQQALADYAVGAGVFGQAANTSSSAFDKFLEAINAAKDQAAAKAAEGAVPDALEGIDELFDKFVQSVSTAAEQGSAQFAAHDGVKETFQALVKEAGSADAIKNFSPEQFQDAFNKAAEQVWQAGVDIADVQNESLLKLMRDTAAKTVNDASTALEGAQHSAVEEQIQNSKTGLSKFLMDTADWFAKENEKTGDRGVDMLKVLGVTAGIVAIAAVANHGRLAPQRARHEEVLESKSQLEQDIGERTKLLKEAAAVVGQSSSSGYSFER